MSSPRTIVVFLATGLQGTALINALTKHNTPTVQYKIIALTRNASSGSAKRLASLAGVSVAQVDKDHQERPLEALKEIGLKKGSIYGIFSCQAYVDDEAMFTQGKAIADAAVALDVKHLVYSSSDNGEMDDCGVSGFEVKRKVERYIQTLPTLRYTFLRPVQFMENFLPDSAFLFKMSRTITMKYTFYTHPDRKHQVISSADIGRAGARAFVQGPEWMDGKVRLAGDSLTVKEIDQIFQDELGEPVQLTYGLLARFVKRMVPILRDMAKFFDEHGYNVDVDALRREMPELEDLRTFLQRYKTAKRA